MARRCGRGKLGIEFSGFAILAARLARQAFLTESYPQVVVRQSIRWQSTNGGAKLGNGSIQVAGIQQTAARVRGESRGLQIGFFLLISAPALLSAAAASLSPS